MVKSMENKQSLLKISSIEIAENLSIKLPTVGEILDDEQNYYSIVSSLTATPFQYMVQLEDMGIDYTTISEYDLFMMLFQIYAKEDLSIIFGDIDISDFDIYYKKTNGTTVLYSPKNDIVIDELVYTKLTNELRKINLLDKVKTKPGNEEAKRYLMEKERKRQKRNANKKREPYLEKLVIALVNRPEFKYDYNSVMDLSIYQFNQSFKQIQTNINFDKTMIGVYAGTVDTSKLSDKQSLSWIPIK